MNVALTGGRQRPIGTRLEIGVETSCVRAKPFGVRLLLHSVWILQQTLVLSQQLVMFDFEDGVLGVQFVFGHRPAPPVSNPQDSGHESGAGLVQIPPLCLASR
jgi:hypothetical protein